MDSVVVPTHDRRERALRLLTALAGQCVTPASFEVLVVVDGSTDGTADALRERCWPFTLQVIEQPRSGPAAARNRGAAAASGDVLVFIDDDAIPPPDFLQRLRRWLGDGTDVVVALTRVAAWVPDGLLAREQRSWDAHGARVAASGSLSAADVHFAATGVRRSCFDAVGGFDVSFTGANAWGNEDIELATRLLDAGCRVVCRPGLIVDVECVTDPVVALRRAYALGRSDVRFARKHPALATRLFGFGLHRARIQRAVGTIVLAVPGASVLLRPLRRIVLAAVARGHAGALLYRLWLVVWAEAWWRGVIDEGGGAIARRELRR